MRLTLWTPLLLASGCGGFFPELTAAGTKVRLMKADPPVACREFGEVRGGGTLENSKIRMRNQAGELGANYVRWETVSSTGDVTGTAFACKESDSSPAIEGVAPAGPN